MIKKHTKYNIQYLYYFLLITIGIFSIRPAYAFFNLGQPFGMPDIDSIPGIDSIKEQLGIPDMKNYLADAAWDGTVGWLFDLFCDFINGIQITFLDHFAPSIDQFNKWVNAGEYLVIFRTIGISLSVLIFGFMIGMCLASTIKLVDVRDTPLQLVVMLIISLIAIVNSIRITNAMFAITKSIWDLLLGGNNAPSIAECILTVCIPTTLASVMWTDNNILQAVGTIIIGIIFFVQFMKLIVEIAERYVVACFLYYAFPAAASTLVSKTTISVFWKYLQMLVCQLLILILNLLFILIISSMFRNTAEDNVLNAGIMGWIFIFAILRAAQRIDSWLFTMGMSIALTGGNVMDSISGAARSMIFMATAATRGGSMALQGTGGLMASMAVNGDGGLGVLKTAKTMEDLSHPIRNASSFGSSNADLLKYATRKGDVGNIISGMDAKNIDSSIIDMARRGTPQDIGTLNMATPDFKQTLADKAFGLSQAVPEGCSLNDVTFERNGVSANITDNNGHESAIKLSSVPSDNPLRTIGLEDGSSMYLSSRNHLAPGESIAFNSDSDNLQMAEYMTGKDLSSLSDDVTSNTNSIIGTDNGFVFSSGTNAEDPGQILARVSDRGDIYYNHDLSLSSDDLQKLSMFKGYDGFQLKDNHDGTVTAWANSTGSHNYGSKFENDAYGHAEFTLYNKAVYPDRSVLQLHDNKFVGHFNKGSQGGSWYVGQVNTRSDSANATSMNKRAANGQNHINITY